MVRWAIWLVLALLTLVALPTHAATTLTVTPITWNVVGLDSNNVNVGPNDFPVGARICNTGGSAASNLTASFVWDSSNSYINNRSGTNTSISVSSLAASTCTDVYFEVEITRDSAAYDTTRNYHIAVTADSGTTTGSTPTPRQVYVEHLVSQSRNSVTGISYGLHGGSLTAVGVGGTMTLIVGNEYDIKVDGATATNGYEQSETFISLPNTIFQLISVSSTYSADTSSYVSSPNDKLYGDACLWDSNPSSPNYRSCLDVGKVGGTISETYHVKILSVPGAPLVNPEPLSTLIYDFSGSSYHYNSDYGVSTRFANIISPATITKAFSPNTIAPNANSTLTYTITNISSNALSNLNFADTTGWPAGMTVSATTVTPSGCGSPTPSSLTVGATSASFSNITVAANSICTISITVTAGTNGSYPNTTQNLFIDTLDTGSKASATLVVSSSGTNTYDCGTAKTTLVRWNFNSGDGGTGASPTYTSPLASGVSSATATAGLNTGATASIDTGTGGTSSVNSWQIATTSGNSTNGWKAITSPPTYTSTPYFEFQVDTSNYSFSEIQLSYNLQTNGDWANPGDNKIYVHTYNGITWSNMSTGLSATKGSWTAYNVTNGVDVIAASTGTNTTTFRINALGAKTGNNDTPSVALDDVTILGCARPTPPTLAKAFSPTTIGSDTSSTTANYSTLTFTIGNPNTGSLNGVAFTDTLPEGLVVANPPTVSTPSCTSGTLTGQTITAAAGSNTISMTGGVLSASAASCTFSVRVQGKAAGSYTNTSSRISATSSGPNTTGGANVGYGQASLTVISAPVIAKAFGANSILTNGTTTLSFTIRNPNASTSLNGVAFTDTLPGGLTVATPNGLSGTCGGGTITATAGSGTVILSGATLAGSASCTFSLNVTGTTTGLKTNSVTVSSTNGGTGNTATANVLVKDPTPGLVLSKKVGTSASGPWYNYLVVSAGSTPNQIWYQFTVENTGDVAFNPVTLTDNTFTPSCTWSPSVTPLPVAVAANDDHISTCVVQNGVAQSGTVTNTAHATGTYGSGSTYNSPNDTATYEGVNPTYAFLSDFRAYALNGTPVIEWRTSGETNTLGFDLYRKDVDQPDESAFVQLNAEVLPALIDAPQGGTYYFVDAGAQVGQTYTYRLVEHEVDLKGKVKERNLGVYTVLIEAQTPVDAEITLVELADDYARKARQPSAEEAARSDAAQVAHQEAKNHKRKKKSSDLVKLYIKDKGLYRVAAADLATLLNIDLKEAKKQIGKYGYELTSQGRDVAYHAADDNSALYFYNPGYDSVYTSTNVFWLGLGKKAGVPMIMVDGVPSTKPKQPKPPVPTGTETFQQMLEFEENHSPVLGLGLHGPEDDYWMWNYLYTAQPELSAKTYTMTAPSVVTSSPATLTVELVGGTDTAANPDHHLVVALNDSTVGETRWDGIAKKTLNLTLDPGVLKAGDNALTLTALKDASVPYSLFYVDRFTLTYPSRYQATNNRLAFNSAQNTAIQVGGFSDSQVALVSLSDPWKPVWVNVIGQALTGGGYGVTLNPASANLPYWAATDSAMPIVDNAWTDKPSQLKQTALNADYLVIAPEEVREAAQALADYREGQGFSTAVVDLEDIMDEFNGGLSSPKAIRDFLSLAYNQWKNPPRFVVLAGSGSYDYQNYLGHDDSLIPPLMVQTPYGLTASDNRLGDVVGDDGMPEIIVGRIPAVNNTELQAYVDKVVAYESAVADPWTRQVVLMADNSPDPAGDFPADSDDLAALVLNPPYQTNKIYLGRMPYQTASLARAGVLNALNQGAAYFSYMGHGNPSQLANEKLLLQSDVTALSNGGRQPVALFLTCAAVRFSLPGYDSLGEALVLKHNGGAIAVWGPTGLSLNSEAKQLAEGFFTETFWMGGNRMLGESAFEAYQHYGTNRYRFILDIYNILGDPALRMK
ncbi:MAG TPA: C25 family cysteine peptidase [Candidatus Competibacter sp.]|nr:hypothetical protein [Candidatus Competibacteraceae bacterium]HPE71532.1 C25 family cysteine peptidase [Candidatus Competibacter sp.]HRW64488.1 C25 family cysteine peptidase [Candidatus Competibacter sp.]